MAANDVADLLLRIDATTEGLRRELKKADKSITDSSRTFDRKLKSIDSRFSQMGAGLRKVNGLLAGLGVALSVKKVQEYSDSWKQVNNQLRQVTSSEAELRNVRTSLLGISKQTNSQLDTTVNLYSELYRSTRDLGTSSEEVADVTKTINNLFLAGGKSASETSGAVRQLAQGLAAGALRGDEFNSVAEGAPRIMDALAAKLQMTRGELRDFAATGGITSAIMVDALQDYRDEAQRMADQTERTFGQRMVNATTNVTQLAGEMDSLSLIVNRAGESVEEFSEDLLGMSKDIDFVIGSMVKLYDVLDKSGQMNKGSNVLRGLLAVPMTYWNGLKSVFDDLTWSVEGMLEELDNPDALAEMNALLGTLEEQTQKTGKATEEFKFKAKDLADTVGDEVVRELNNFFQELQRLEDKLDPLGAETRQLKQDLQTLETALQLKKVTPEKYIEMREQLLRVDETVRELTESTDEFTKQTDWMTEIFIHGIERMQDALSDFLYEFLDQGKVTFDRFLDLFKRMVAEMSATKIMLSLGIGGTSSVASAVGAVSSGVSGLSMIGGILNAGGLNQSLLSGAGLITSTLAKLPVIGGAVGNAGAGLISLLASAPGGMAGGLGIAGAGIYGLMQLTKGLFGDGYKRQATGVSIEPYWAGQDTTGYTRFGASGLRFHGTVAGKGDPALANQFVDMLAATDTALTTFFETLGNEIDLTGQTIKGSQSDNGKWGKFFFGSKDGSSFEDAMDGFVNAWLQKVEEVTGEVVNLDLIKDLGLEGEALGDTLNRISVEFVSVNSIFEAMGLTLYDTNVAGMAAADGLVQAMGGLDNLTASLSTYYDLFYTEQEKLDNITTQVQSVFDSLNLTMPDTRDGFRALVDSLDLTTSEGQNTFAALISVAGAFAEITPVVEEIETTVEDFVDNTVDVMANLDTAFADFEKAIASQIQVHQDNITELEGQKQLIQDNLQGMRDQVDVVYTGMERWADQQIDSINAQADAQIDSLRKVTDASQTAYTSTVDRLKDALDPIRDSISFLSDASGALRQTLYRLRPQSAEFDRKARANAQATLQAALGGNLPSMDVLNNALSVVSQDSTDQFGSKNAYLRDFFATQNTVSQLLRETEGQLTIEEQTLSGIEAHIDLAEKNHSESVDLINQQIQAINASREAQVKGVEDQLKLAKDQIDALDGIDTNVYTLSDVTRAIQTYEQAKAIADEQMLQIDQQIQNEFDSIALLEDQLEVETNSYQELKGISSGVSSVSAAIDRLHAAMAEVGTAAEIPAFAKGGFHKGGWGVFGENGPEIAYTPPTQVFTNADSQRMMQSFGGEQQRAYNEAALRGIAKNTADIRKLRDIFDKWDADGLPAERTA